MNVYTVVSDKHDVFSKGEKLLGVDVEEWLSEGSLSTGMVLSGPDGFVRVKRDGRSQVLEKCSYSGKFGASEKLKLEILYFIGQQESPPSLREIGAAFGIVVSHVSYYLKALEESGLIVRERAKQRSIRLTAAGANICQQRDSR